MGFMNKIQIDKYKPYKGFFDLRSFKLSIKLFKQLWKIQDALHEMEKNKNYYKKWHPAQWERAKELSANYQSILLSAPNQSLDSDGKKPPQVS